MPRAYYPGRSGQIMLVPREGDFVTLNEPASLFMHGVVGAMMQTFLCCFLALLLSVGHLRRCSGAAGHCFQIGQVPQIAPAPDGHWPIAGKPWIHRLVARAPFWW